MSLGWSATELVGLVPSNVRPVVSLEITDEMWTSICEKAEAEGMDPDAWFEREIERAKREAS